MKKAQMKALVVGLERSGLATLELLSKRGAELRKLRERGLADNRNSIVRRKIVAVVGEGDEAEGVDEAVR